MEIFRQLKQWHFNPLSLYRERQNTCPCPYTVTVFQSTLPIQGETMCYLEDVQKELKFQSTLPIQGETVNRIPDADLIAKISIHSPYTGRDDEATGDRAVQREISIHSPYTGRDSNFAHKTPNIQPILLCKTPNKRTFSNTYTTNYNFPSPHIINIQVRISLHFHVHFTFALNHSRI